MWSFRYFCIFIVFFSSKNISLFWERASKGLAKYLSTPLTWETFSVCFIVLRNLQEVFGCTIKKLILCQKCLGFLKILVVE